MRSEFLKARHGLNTTVHQGLLDQCYQFCCSAMCRQRDCILRELLARAAAKASEISSIYEPDIQRLRSRMKECAAKIRALKKITSQLSAYELKRFASELKSTKAQKLKSSRAQKRLYKRYEADVRELRAVSIRFIAPSDRNPQNT